jgi:hypothetical protein
LYISRPGKNAKEKAIAWPIPKMLMVIPGFPDLTRLPTADAVDIVKGVITFDEYNQ